MSTNDAMSRMVEALVAMQATQAANHQELLAIQRANHQEMKSEIARLEAKVDANYESLKSEIARLDAKIDALDAKVDTIHESLKSEIARLDAKIDALDVKVDTIHESLKSEIARLDAKIDALDAKVDANHEHAKAALVQDVAVPINRLNQRMDRIEGEMKIVRRELNSVLFHASGRSLDIDDRLQKLEDSVFPPSAPQS